MNDIHESFLKLFFQKLNEKFPNKWCVLHSYENLPYFSESDVDMSLSNIDICELEDTIYDVANVSEWEVLQKLWYDIESCFYYVLKNKKSNIFLALDFLIDNRGLGAYGLNSTFLTNKIKYYNDFIPIPSNEVAFTYKLTKRLIKKHNLVNDKDYLDYHLSMSDKKLLSRFLEIQFGKKSFNLIGEIIHNNNYKLNKDSIKELLYNRNEVINSKMKILLRLIFNVKRIFSRVYFPSGLILKVPLIDESDLKFFQKKLKKKLSITFRDYKIIYKNSFYNKIKLMSGSTMTIERCNKINKVGEIRFTWFKVKKIYFDINNIADIDALVETYRYEIIKILKKRIDLRNDKV